MVFLTFAKYDPYTASVSRGGEQTPRVSCESTLSPGGSVSKEREEKA